MAIYFSASTNGFYDEAVTSPPDGSIEVSQEQYSQLMDAQTNGKIITADVNGNPVAIDKPLPSAQEQALVSIRVLEGQITPRRMREAVLGVDNGWLKSINDQIDALRGSNG